MYLFRFSSPLDALNSYDTGLPDNNGQVLKIYQNGLPNFFLSCCWTWQRANCWMNLNLNKADKRWTKISFGGFQTFKFLHKYVLILLEKK